MKVEWKGIFTALVTPFKSNGDLDEKGLSTLVRRQVDAGIHGLVPCGTTGETPTLSEEEWSRVIEITVNEAGGKAWVVAGSGTNSTAKSIEKTRKAKELGADGALIVSPYYNKPTQDGIKLHFKTIAEDNPDFPIMVYNIPGRSGVNITPASVEELMELPAIASVKEASGDLAQIWEVSRRCGKVVSIFSGDDGLNLPIWEVGGVGAISVLSNIAPEKVLELWKLHGENQAETAYHLHNSLLPLTKSLFMETSPTPVKHALALLGLPSGPVRLPLAPVREATRAMISNNLKALKLL